MIELTFTGDAVDQLKELALRHPHPGVRLKSMAVLLKSLGLKTNAPESLRHSCQGRYSRATGIQPIKIS